MKRTAYADPTKVLGPCSREGCERPRIRNRHHAYCESCHYRACRYGDPAAGPRGALHIPGHSDGCAVDGCELPARARGWCVQHYQQWWKTGSPEKRRHYEFRQPGKPGAVHNAGKGYVKVYFPEHPNADSSGSLSEHVLAMSEHLGRALRKGETVHHKNGNRSDNRVDNLELWSTSHPAGQRVRDLVAWAQEVLALYGEEVQLRLL